MPLVVCTTSTCGRPNLLEEAIYCFLLQDYPNKKLIILNDHPGQKLNLISNFTNVQIINQVVRMSSLGAKRDWLRKYAIDVEKANYFAIWDDDDLHTPWKLSESIRYLEANPTVDIYKPHHAISLVDNQFSAISANYYEASAVIRATYGATHTYNKNISVRMDLEFMQDAKIYAPLETDCWSYIYRWGMHIHHLSGLPDTPDNWSSAFERVKVVPDAVDLVPQFYANHWKTILLALKNAEWSKKINVYL